MFFEFSWPGSMCFFLQFKNCRTAEFSLNENLIYECTNAQNYVRMCEISHFRTIAGVCVRSCAKWFVVVQKCEIMCECAKFRTFAHLRVQNRVCNVCAMCMRKFSHTIILKIGWELRGMGTKKVPNSKLQFAPSETPKSAPCAPPYAPPGVQKISPIPRGI